MFNYNFLFPFAQMVLCKVFKVRFIKISISTQSFYYFIVDCDSSGKHIYLIDELLSVRVKPRNTSISIDLTNYNSLGQIKSGYILPVTKRQDKEIEIFKYTFYGISDAM